MKMKKERLLAAVMATCLLLSLSACGASTAEPAAAGESVTVTDMIGREVEIVPGSYERVACIGAGALRMYC